MNVDYAELGIIAIIPSPGLCRALGLFPLKIAAFKPTAFFYRSRYSA